MSKKAKILSVAIVAVVIATSLGVVYTMHAGNELSDNEKLELLKQFAPKVYFHSGEKYFPGDVNDWFKATELRYMLEDTRNRAGGLVVVSGGVKSALVQKDVTADNIGNSSYEGKSSNSDKNFFLKRVDSAAQYGDNDGTVDAPVYAYFYQDDEYTELTYKFWYPHNGNIADNIPFFDAASHQGDWEAVTVILKTDTRALVGAIFNAHSDENQFYRKDELQYINNHPYVYSGRFSHASYSLKAATKTDTHDWKIDRPGGTNPYVPDDHISDNAKTWDTWNNVILLKDQPWLNYRGRWGDLSSEYMDGPYGPGKGISSRVNDSKNTIQFFQRDDCIGNMRAPMKAKGDITYNIKSDPPSGVTKLANDAIRSVKLVMVEKDTLLRLYDSPEGSKTDDYVDIHVKRDIPFSTEVNKLESFLTNDDVLVLPHLYNGLTGKISRIEVKKNVPTPLSVARYYEGNNATQDLVGTMDLSKNLNVGLKNNVIDNDEIRSMIIMDGRKGTLLTFYDDPDGKTSDDWAEVYIKKNTAQIQVDTFERYVDNDSVRVIPHYVNGLDGKISYIRVNTDYGDLPAGSVMFYEGNNCTQDLLGTFNVQYTRVNLKNNKMDNDEARSMRLKNVVPGTVIRVFDSPDGSWNDDVCTVTVKKYVVDYNVGTFQRSWEDDYLKVEYKKHNGLDGKVSRIEIN